MQYYAAPMEGLTDRVWRQAQQKWFGPEGTAHRYYAPFLSPPENRVLIKKKMAELAPAANPGAPVIPQLLAKDGELAAWMIGELRALGYTEVNLNLGCPSGTVTAKGKGSGMLRDPAVLDAFLDAVFSHAEGPISVKTRLGVSSPDEFAAILDIYDRYPICELTIHPRVMRQLYRGQADRAAFAEALPRCTMPVCYNGDVTAPEELHALETSVPAAVRHHDRAGLHRRPGPAAAGPRRDRCLPRGTAGLSGRPVPRLHGAVRQRRLCREPHESPLVLPHPPLCRVGKAGKAAAQGPGALGVRGAGEPDLHPAHALSFCAGRAGGGAFSVEQSRRLEPRRAALGAGAPASRTVRRRKLPRLPTSTNKQKTPPPLYGQRS